MKVLIVGAGSVGQVIGRHLSLAGAEVHVLVKPRHVDAAQVGYALVPLHRPAARVAAVRWWPREVHTDPPSIGAFDQVWLALPSPALAGPWLGALLEHPGEATVVLLTAALGDRERVLAHLPATHLVQGMLSLVAYAGPLPGEELPEPATVYWFPPGAPTRFAGPHARVREVVELLEAGGMPAAADEAHAAVSASTGAVVMPHLAALEAAGWSLDALRAGDLLRLAHEASEEARAIVGAVEGEAPHGHAPAVLLVRLLTEVAPGLLPFPLEPYLRQHFTKVGAQTRLNMERYVEAGRARSMPVAALVELLQRRPVSAPPPG